MVSTLFTALALIAAGQAETTRSSSSALESVRGERSALAPPRRAAPKRSMLGRRQD